MRVGYRRLSGSIGLTDQESGTRGLWWEKRLALLAALRSRGNEVILLSKPSRHSRGMWPWPPDPSPVDLMLVEFGGTNLMYFADDLAETDRMLQAHNGRAIYVCDDPDLLPPSSFLPWFDGVWANTESALPGMSGTPVVDFPFASLAEPCSAGVDYAPRLAYIGRPGGRGRDLLGLIRLPIDFYGRAAEWEKHDIEPIPEPPQPLRAALYAQYAGGLALAATKHKVLAWRTGRATHCIMAGAPSAVPADHPGLVPYGYKFSSATELEALIGRWCDPALRTADLELMQARILRDRPLAIKAMEEAGL